MEPLPASAYADALREVVALARRYHALAAQSLDLHPTSLSAMEALARSGSLTPTELSDRLGLSPAATTNVLHRLESLGHAERAGNDADGRSVRISATPSATRAAGERLRPLITAMSDRMARYSPEELALVVGFLGDVADAYREGIAAFAEPPRDL